MKHDVKNTPASNMFNTFFAKSIRAFVWLLDLYTENAESSSKQLKLSAQF